MNEIKHPYIYAVGGAPASGKTSFVEKSIRLGKLPHSAFIHDCDAIMVSLPGYQDCLNQFGAATAFKQWEMPARIHAENLLEKAIEAKQEIIYDRSCALFSSYSFLENLVKNQGYKLLLHILFVDESEAIIRAEKREREINRHIPKNVLQERLATISALWPLYLSFSEEAYLYDNNDFSVRLVASYKAKDLHIENELQYKKFISQGKNICQKMLS